MLWEDKIEKIMGALAIAGLDIILAGCGNQNTQSNSNTAKSSSEASSSQNTTNNAPIL